MMVAATILLAALLPDPVITPGVVRTTSTKVVCSLRSTKDVRHVTSAQMKQVYNLYHTAPGVGRCSWVYRQSKKIDPKTGRPRRIREGCEIDHLDSLELGGANDVKNLWPQPYRSPGAHEKDRLENWLHQQVCAGKMKLADAQQSVTRDWWKAYQQMLRTK